MTKTDSKPDQAEPIDFPAQAKRAEEARLAGNLDEAEAAYYEIVDLGTAAAEGYGNHHLGLCALVRGDEAKETGADELAKGFYEEAVVLYDKAFASYCEDEDFVRASAAMLDRGVLTLRRGRITDAIEEIEQSTRYLEVNTGKKVNREPDRGFIDEHLGIKYARLAEAHLAQGNVTDARKAISVSIATPQRNPYFVMVRTEIDGHISQAEGDFTTAEDAFTLAALKADALGATVRKQQILEALEALRNNADAGLPADHDSKE